MQSTSSSSSSSPPSLPQHATTSKYKFPKASIVTATERDFLHLYTPKAVLKMIKDGSYESKLTAFLDIGEPPSEDRAVVLREMFRKHLTQSDVGKRKGLVVTKKDAEEYFPEVKKREGTESMVLRFLDGRTREWLEFRYCFYRSSQSYVLTTGWCKFVRANCLKEKDVIKFYECATDDGEHEERYVMIDIVGRGREEKRSTKALSEEGEIVSTTTSTYASRKRRLGNHEEVKVVRKESEGRGRVRLFGVVIG